MKNISVCYAVLLFICFAFTVNLVGQPKIYLVRHCEKIENWQTDLSDFQPLNEEGIESSKRLNQYFNKINLKAIYSSPVTRTLQTAYLVSKSKSLNINAEHACNDTLLINSFVDYINDLYVNTESVLIVSHSNIIPYFLRKLGLQPEQYKKFNISEKDNWLLTDYYGYVFIVEQKENSANIYREKF